MTDAADPVAMRIGADPMDATLAVDGSSWVLTITRELPHPVDRVWSMLTDPALLARWSPVVPDRSLTTEGPATSHETPDAPGVDVAVLTCTAPTELVHRWGEHQLRWTLAGTEAGTLLVLEQTVGSKADSPRYAAGWHICLAVLATVLSGADVPRVVGELSHTYGWDALCSTYEGCLR